MEAFTPIVEALLKYDIDSAEFKSAAEVAGPAETDEALRQIRQKIGWICEREDAIEHRLDDLAAEYGSRD